MNPPWSQAVDAYIERLEGNNVSPATIETYRTFLEGGRARRFRIAHGIVYPHEFSAEVFEAMKIEFRADGLRPITVQGYVRVWRQFAKFCMRQGWGVQLSTLQVANPKVPKVLPATLTDKQIEELIAACSCTRDKILVKFPIETGLRRSEVANITLEDIIADPAGWVVRAQRGKGAKGRTVPISDAFADELGQFLRMRPKTQCRALFLTRNRKRHTADGSDFAPLGAVGVYQVWRRLSQKTGIKAYPHKGRHTAATRWAADGVVPWAIQRALGHTTLAMTNRYVDATAVDVSAMFKAAKESIREGGTARGIDELALSLLEGVSARDLIRMLVTRENQKRLEEQR